MDLYPPGSEKTFRNAIMICAKPRFLFPMLSALTAVILPAVAIAQGTSPKAAPAKLPDNSGQADLVDNPVTFRLVQLAFVETSLKLVDEAIVKAGAQSKSSASKVDYFRKNNEMMDRKGGGPVTWDKFYGQTADKFYFHGKVAANLKARPPQFDYIYRANSDQMQRAQDEIAELGGKVDKLQERKRQLEHQQVALWGQIAGALVAQRDLESQPLYSFYLKIDGMEKDPLLLRRVKAIESLAQFLRVLDKSAGFVGQNMSKDQALALASLKENVASARKDLVRDLASAISADSDVRQQTEQLSDLARRLVTVTNSAAETRNTAMEAEAIGDDAQRESSRGLLQTAIIDFADKTASFDDGLVKLAEEWKIQPLTDKPRSEVRLVSVSLPPTSPAATPASPAAPSPSLSIAPTVQSFFNGKDLTGWEGMPGYWQVRDGAIVGAPFKGVPAQTFLYSKRTYKDFELKYSVLLKNDRGNSGVNVRSHVKNVSKFWVGGPQVEINRSSIRFATGSVVTDPSGPPAIPATKEVVDKAWKANQFNEMTIRCVGKHIKVTLNGVVTVDDEFPSMPDEGLISWQLHEKQSPEEIVFKNIQFTNLGSSDAPKSSSQPNRTNAGVAQRQSDLLQPGSVWVSEDTNGRIDRTLTVHTRTGGEFTGRIVFSGGRIVRDMRGSVDGGKFGWYAKDVTAVRGAPGEDNFGTLDGEEISITTPKSFTMRLRRE